MLKSTKILLITAGILIGVGLIVGGISMMVSKARFGVLGGKPHGTNLQNKTMTITDDFEDIEISEVSADVSILLSDKSEAYVEYTDADDYTHEIEVKGDKLQIIRKDNNTLSGGFMFNLNWLFGEDSDYEEGPVNLYLPEGEYGDLSIHVVSGDVVVDPMAYEKVHVEAVSGEVKIGGCEIEDKIDIATVSGSVLIDEVTCGNVDVDVTSGDITISNSTVGETDLNSVSGNMNLLSVSASSVDIDSTSGEIVLNDYQSKDTEINTISGDINGTLIGDYKVDFDTVSGDMDVANSVSGGARFDVETTSGDLKLENK